IYASSNDVALKISRSLRGYRRVGETADGVLVYPGSETVDSTAAAPLLRAYGHSYVFDSNRLPSAAQALVRFQQAGSVYAEAALRQSQGLPGRVFNRHVKQGEECRHRFKRRVQAQLPRQHLVAHLPAIVPVIDVEVALEQVNNEQVTRGLAVGSG